MLSPLAHGQGLGTEVWEVDFHKPAFPGGNETPGTIFQTPTIAPDGSIFVSFGNGGARVNPDGTYSPYGQSWFPALLIAVGPNGTVYVSGTTANPFFEPRNSDYFAALKPDGTVRWGVSRVLDPMPGTGFQIPAVSGNGIYVGSKEGFVPTSVSAFDEDGNVQWQFPLTTSFFPSPRSVTLGLPGQFM